MVTRVRLDDIKTKTLEKIQNDPFYSFFAPLDVSVLEQAYYNAFELLDLGLEDMLNITREATGDNFITKFMSDLTCAYLIRYNFKPYLKYDSDNDKWHFEDAGAVPALFRTISTQTMDGVSVSFESERLGIDISAPLEQMLSTSSFGFDCIQPIKNYIKRKGRILVF